MPEVADEERVLVVAGVAVRVPVVVTVRVPVEVVVVAVLEPVVAERVPWLTVTVRVPALWLSKVVRTAPERVPAEAVTTLPARVPVSA